jgi:hypothetical protein
MHTPAVRRPELNLNRRRDSQEQNSITRESSCKGARRQARRCGESACSSSSHSPARSVSDRCSLDRALSALVHSLHRAQMSSQNADVHKQAPTTATADDLDKINKMLKEMVRHAHTSCTCVPLFARSLRLSPSPGFFSCSAHVHVHDDRG